MSKLSRAKGASFERELVKIFREELGVECRRNLTQYQESELGDIELGELILVEAKKMKERHYSLQCWLCSIIQTALTFLVNFGH